MEITEDEFMDVINNDSMFQGKYLAWMWETRNENRLLKYYRQLSRQGKEITVERVKNLAELSVF